MDNEQKILVIYLGISAFDSTEIESYVQQISNKIIPETFKGEIIIIPTHSFDSKIECINPKYITDKDLIYEHETKMKELLNNLKEQEKVVQKKIKQNKKK